MKIPNKDNTVVYAVVGEKRGEVHAVFTDESLAEAVARSGRLDTCTGSYVEEIEVDRYLQFKWVQALQKKVAR